MNKFYRKRKVNISVEYEGFFKMLLDVIVLVWWRIGFDLYWGVIVFNVIVLLSFYLYWGFVFKCDYELKNNLFRKLSDFI